MEEEREAEERQARRSWPSQDQEKKTSDKKEVTTIPHESTYANRINVIFKCA